MFPRLKSSPNQNQNSSSLTLAPEPSTIREASAAGATFVLSIDMYYVVLFFYQERFYSRLGILLLGKIVVVPLKQKKVRSTRYIRLFHFKTHSIVLLCGIKSNDEELVLGTNK
jgi:hypothetical protein